MSRDQCLAALLLVLTVGLSLSHAQGARGSIQGSVQDPDGAVVPGTKLVLTNIETGVRHEGETNAEGLYVFPNLFPGNYEIQTSQSGFTSVSRKGIVVTVGGTVVVNITMPVGALEETVTVTEAPPLVQSTNATISNIVVGEQVQQLPLNGRDFTRLAELQPGVVFNSTGSRSAFGGKEANFLVNGQIDQSTLFLMDGSEINDLTFGYSPKDASGQFLGLDSIQEFRLLSSNYSAEFGRNPGGVVQAVTKGGTNGLHGSLFFFHRNEALDAKNFFDVPGRPIPPFNRNQFGFAVGGPIKKDHTFFFVNYESLRERLSVTSVATVPNEDARNGILPDPNNPGGTINVPVNLAVIPFLDLYPLPNGRDLGDGTALFTTSGLQPADSDLFVVRIDTTLGANDSLFGRFYIDESDSEQPFGNVPVPGFPGLVRHNFAFLTLQETKAFSPTLMNVLGFSFNRTDQAVTLPPPPSGLPSISLIPGTPLGLIDVRGMSPVGNQIIFPIGGVQNLFEVRDQLTVVHGKHNIRTGVDVRRFQVNDIFDLAVNGNFIFNGLTNFLLGTPSTFLGVQPGSNSNRGWRWVSFAGYIQDDIRLTPALTVNLGLRYEFNSVPSEVDGKISNLRNASDPQVTVGGPLFNSVNDLFDPRIGIAWTPFPNTVVRAGYGIFRDQIIVNIFGNSRFSPPFMVGAFGVNPAFPDASAGGLASITLTVQSIDFTLEQPTVHQWNVQVQRQLTSTTVVNIGYVGNRGLHRVRSKEANSAIPTILPDGTKFFPPGVTRRNPNFGPVRERTTDGQSWYNALQLELDQRFFNGFLGKVAYTFSRTIDTNSSSFTNFPNNPGNTQDPDDISADKALAPFHQKHRVVVNALYELPFGHGKTFLSGASPGLDLAVGGWRVGGIYTYNSGPPFTPALGFNRSNSLQTGTAIADRPNINPNFTGDIILGDPSRWFDPNAFELQPAGFFGNAGRNTLNGPNLQSLDLTVAKDFPVRESLGVEFRMDIFNSLNRPNFDVPNNTTAFNVAGGDIIFSNPSGVPVGNAGQIFRTVTTSRQIQFSLRVNF